MKYKITIDELIEKEGDSYPKERSVYTQVVENIDLLAVIKAVNSVKES